METRDASMTMIELQAFLARTAEELGRRPDFQALDHAAVAQGTLLALLARYPDLLVRPAGQVKRMARRALVRDFIDQARPKRIRQSQSLEALMEAGAFELRDRLAHPGPGPHTSLGEGEERAQLYAAIDRLPPRQKAIVALVYFDRLTQKDAAEQLKVSYARLRGQLTDALGALARLMKAGGGRG
jgi:RNA polymerase sigma factor (sigma-70 family)